MKERGYERSQDQCRVKVKKLRQTYEGVRRIEEEWEFWRRKRQMSLITRKLQHLQMTPLMERTTVLHPAVMKQRKKGRLSVVFRQGGTWEGSAKLKLQRLTVGCRLILPSKPSSCNRCLKLSKTVKRRRVQLWRVF
uniref:Uncharacterized protein n=1 Tax=Knipowitschia caucasica TaxID=637954 RepID=A0AAV2J4E2_KNICA